MKKILLAIIMLLAIMPFALAIERTVSPSTVAPGAQVTVSYTGALEVTGIKEQIPTGFTLVSGINAQLIGNELRAFWTGSTYSYVLQAPSTENTYTITGVYEATSQATGQVNGDLGSSVITVQTTTNGGDGDTGTDDTDSDGFDFSNPLVWVIGGVVLILLIVVGSKK